MEKNKLKNNERYFSELRTATFRKEQFDYIHTGIIDENGEMWTTTELDEANINQVYNQYRKKYGIPFPDEIIELRKHYGVSSAKMAEILGFGINQYRYYEDGEVPSISNARNIIAIRSKGMFLDFLEASRETIGEKEYAKISKHIKEIGDYQKPYPTPSVMTGYVSLSLEKIKVVMLYFINKMDEIYVTKMNKLLFYTDFLSYKRHGYGMTGLEYAALPYGPVPDQWGKVYSSIPEVSMNECIRYEQSSGILLESNANANLDILSDIEKKVLKDVFHYFKGMSAKEISLASHDEKGWIDNNAQKGYINYQYAFDLSMQ